jgi:DNA-binding protein H-NS
MKNDDLKSMSVDELWTFHESVVEELGKKIASERAKLESRLRQLLSASSGALKTERRPYPKVVAKYRNPQNRTETWAGRGKKPRWLTTALRSGKKLDDFLIRKS